MKVSKSQAVVTIAIILISKSSFGAGQYSYSHRRQSRNDSVPVHPISPEQVSQLNCTDGPPVPADGVKGPPPPQGPPPEEPPPIPPPPDFVPLGLEKVILLMVPQFKCPIHKTSKWWKASAKMSFPINVFFDKLVVPKDSPPLIFFPFGAFRGPEPPPKVKRSVDSKSILSLPPPESVRGGERATIIPRLEMLLESYGIRGKGCLLRALCEVHETSLVESYGFFGEILTVLFTVSNSAYGKSHLPEYLKAEEMGKGEGCSSYFENCEDSLFHSDYDDDLNFDHSQNIAQSDK